MSRCSMNPGDVVVVVNSTEEKIDDDILGHTGMIVGAVTLEDGYWINSWYDQDLEAAMGFGIEKPVVD